MNPSDPAAIPGAMPARTFRLRHELLGRLRFVLPFGAAGIVGWWSWARLAPVLGESSRLAGQAHQLNRQIEQFEAVCRQAEADSVPSRQAAARGRLVGGEAELASWLQVLHETAAGLGLEVKAESGVIEKQTIGGQQLALVPLWLEVRPATGVPLRETAYRRLLRFGQWISMESPKAVVTELLVSGPNGAVIRAGISLRLWVMPPVI